jgi:glycosyltransferase involved in cell wall biosynthesis
VPSGILVIVPAYHEERTLPSLLPKVRSVLPEAEILVVDDGSRDGTSAAARAGGARVARHPINLGYGAAIQTGYRWAVRRDVEVVLQIDADGQHDPESLRDLLRACTDGDWDLVLGSRFLGGARPYRAPLARRLGMAFFSRVSSAVLGRRITDPTTGFQAIGHRLVRYYAEGRFFPPDYPDADVLIRVGRAGFRVTEIPVTMYEKDGPSMHSGLRPIYYVLKMVLSILLVLTFARTARREIP